MDRVEQEEARRVRGIIDSEFAKRRQAGPSRPTPRRPAEPSTDVTVVKPEQNAIRNVTLETRENWTRHLMKALQTNWFVSGPPAGVTAKTCAEQLEYGMYSISKNETTYKNKCGHKVCFLSLFSWKSTPVTFRIHESPYLAARRNQTTLSQKRAVPVREHSCRAERICQGRRSLNFMTRIFFYHYHFIRLSDSSYHIIYEVFRFTATSLLLEVHRLP